MNAMWMVCRMVAVTLLSAVIVGTGFDLTATELFDGCLFLIKAALFVATLLAVFLIGLMLVDAWKDQ